MDSDVCNHLLNFNYSPNENFSVYHDNKKYVLELKERYER